MKVFNTWKPVLPEERTNTCIPTKSIQICVEHLRKYTPSNKSVRLFKYDASSTSTAPNEDSLMPSASSLNSLYSRTPNNDVTKAKDLPTAVSKLIHIDLKQLTRGGSFDGAVFASAERNAKSNLPHIVSEQNSKKCTCDSEQPSTSNRPKAMFLNSTSKHAAIVNNVVYTPIGEKQIKSMVPTPVKIFSPKMVLEKLSKKSPPNSQQSKKVSTKTVQLPSSLATLRITSKNKNSLMSDTKIETRDLVYKEGRTQAKTQIRARLDSRIPKPKLNCNIHNKELPILNLPINHPALLQKNERKVSDVHTQRDLLVFNEQISKFQALHELIKVLREQKRSYPENTFLQHLHKKLKKETSHFNMARLQRLKELNASSPNQSSAKEMVKDQKQRLCRMRTFCSQVQPYSMVDRPTKNELCTLATTMTSSTNFRRNHSEPIGKNELHPQQRKTTPFHSTANPNNLRRYTMREHIKLSSSNGRLFNNIHLKQRNAGKRSFIIDDLKINLIDLEKKIRKYTSKRITPLCEDNNSSFERNKLHKMSRENTKGQLECVVGRSSNMTSTLNDDTGGNKKTEFRISRMRKDTSISLPDSLVFNKQTSFSSKLSDKKDFKTLENSILVKGCFHDRQMKSEQCNSKDSLHQQKSTAKERIVAQSIRKFDSKLECNRKQATRLKTTPYRVNTSPEKNCTSNDTASKLPQQQDGSPRTTNQGCSSTEVNQSQEENWRVKSPRQMYSKDTLKAFTFRSQSFYSDYEHRKFRQF